MPVAIRMPRSLHQQMCADLARPHEHAAERVGFAYGYQANAGNSIVVLLNRFEPVADENYLPDAMVGARINSSAILRGMQGVLDYQASCFHVHAHPFRGRIYPSHTDLEGIPPIAASMLGLVPNQTFGFLILNEDSISGWTVLGPDTSVTPIGKLSIVGAPFSLHWSEK